MWNWDTNAKVIRDRQGGKHSRRLLRDCEFFGNLRITSVSSSTADYLANVRLTLTHPPPLPTTSSSHRQRQTLNPPTLIYVLRWRWGSLAQIKHKVFSTSLMNRHKANGVISLLMFKIVDYDYYIKAAKSIYVLSKNLKSVWNRGWLWLPCISAGNHDKTHKISLNVGPSSEEQWGQVSRDQAESDVITATAQLQPSRKHLLTIKMQQNRNHRLQRKLERIRNCVHIKRCLTMNWN